ncbi:MAG: class I SAM-dependent methyltransferase [Planctomycetes bacterium]|nr:class I SAM-dependent methyltransferase [Planctomycetota bacterium]MBI3844310.1 class I SAM-dependent methyltransferase [Planctomycetota bacterium]
MTTPKSYKDWWNEHSKTSVEAFSVVTNAATDVQFQAEGKRVADSFLALGLCDSKSAVLEIGCGVARIGRELAPRVARFVGVDISDNMVAHARERTADLKNVEFHALTGPSLAMLGDGTFDFAYATIMLFHLDKEDLFEYLREIQRALRVGGRIYVDTLNIDGDWTLTKWLGDQKNHVGDAKHLDRSRNQYASAVELRHYLELLGFDAIEIHEADLLHAIAKKGSRARREAPRYYLQGHVDSPLENELTLSPSARIHGWAYDPANAVASVHVLVDGARKVDAEYGLLRADIGHAVKDDPAAGRCGFGIDVAKLALGDGWHTVEVIARRKDGSTFSAGKRAFRLNA